MFSCPGCRSRIPAELPTSHWTCPHCQGTHIPFAILKAVTGSEHVRAVDVALRKPVHIHETKRCLRCGLRLTTLSVDVGKSLLPIEICSRCRFLWYERGMLRAPQKMAAGSTTVSFDGNAARQSAADPHEDTVVDWVPSAAPLPAEEEVFLPSVTLVTLAALAAGSLHAFQDWVPSERHYGFFTEAPWRHFGLTWLTASLVATDWYELIVMLFFLYGFGEIAERRLGARDYLRLLFVSTISSRLLMLVFDGGRDLGALGMVCGVIAYQMLTAPHARILAGRWYRTGLPAWTAALIFLGTRIAAAPPKLFFSYLGGAIGGVLCWAMVRLPSRKPPERRMAPR